MKAIILGWLFSLLAISSAVAQQPDAIGHIQTLKGPSFIVRDNKAIPVTVGASVYRGDTIRTAKKGSVGIVLADDSSFSLGPNSEIVFKDFLFNPKEGKFSIIARMAKGTFAYLSGIIGKLSPSSIRLEIPDATIAVRGTRLMIIVEG